MPHSIKILLVTQCIHSRIYKNGAQTDELLQSSTFRANISITIKFSKIFHMTKIVDY